jgi:AP-2 complex subunit mu-1
MIGVIIFMNSRGDIILSRALRDGYSIRVLAETFRNEIIATRRIERCPVNMIDKVCFCHMRIENIFVVGVSNSNVNCMMTFQYMVQLLQIFKDFFYRLDEVALKDNFVLVQELIDETLDFGYPQITETDILKTYISEDGVRGDVLKKVKEAEQITIKATGKIPWRKEGILYRENEVFIDVMEEVNMLMSQSGEVLQREVVGTMIMRGFLSGMPECQVVLNDQSLVDRARAAASAGLGGGGGSSSTPSSKVELDDVTFHSCVKLNTFENDRSIVFCPPDGEFVLMRYRSSSKVVPPIRILLARVKEQSKTRMEVDFRLKADFPEKFNATNVVVKIPCPNNTASVKIRVATGKAKYDATCHSIVWKLNSLIGGAEIGFSAEISLIQSTLAAHEKVWARPPITVGFALSMYSTSGVQVEQLKITEPKLNYTAKKWVRYLSKGGQYQCRI